MNPATILAQPTLAYLRQADWQWALLIYNPAGQLVDIPQDDIESIEVEDVINGGSGEGTITFRRPFNSIGALGFRYLFQLFIWRRGTTRPTDPWWSGHFTDFDQKELATTGQIVAKCDGDFALLNDATINLEINPGLGTNPGLDAATFITGLLANFQSDAYFGTPTIPSTMFPLNPTDFTMTKLGDALDITTKIGREQTTGALYTWVVRTKGNLTRAVVVQVDQNPNVVSGVEFVHVFKDSSYMNYLVATKYRDVFNVCSVFGGYDENGTQIFGVYEDPTSISALGAAIETQLENSAIISQAAAETYAEIQLDLYSSPTAQGNFTLFAPNPAILAGTWVQIWETPEAATQEATIKQVRCSTVKISIKAGVISQTCTLDAPTPYLDDAIYRLGTQVAVQAAIQNLATPANAQTLYVIVGGTVGSTTSSPATITTTAVEAVFPNVGIVTAAGLTNQPVTDNSGSSTNGQTGDGPYTLSLTSSGTYVITKGALPPIVSSTQQNLVSIFVLGGVPFVTDVRNLAQGNPAAPSLTAPTLSGSATLVAPVNAGQSTFTQRVQFTLAAPLSSSPWLSEFVLQAVPANSSGTPLVDSTGTQLPPSRSVLFSPTANDEYDVSIQLGAGQYYALEVCSIDQYGRVSAPLVLGNTANNQMAPVNLAASGQNLVVDSNMSSGVVFDLSVSGVAGAGSSKGSPFWSYANMTGSTTGMYLAKGHASDGSNAIIVTNAAHAYSGSDLTPMTIPAGSVVWLSGYCASTVALVGGTTPEWQLVDATTGAVYLTAPYTGILGPRSFSATSWTPSADTIVVIKFVAGGANPSGGILVFAEPMVNIGAQSNYVPGPATNTAVSSGGNAQASTLPTVPNFVLDYAFTSGSTTMTYWAGGGGVSGATIPIYFPDGSVVNAPAIGTSASPLSYNAGSTGATIYALIYYSLSSAAWVTTFQTTQITPAQIAAANADGAIAMIASYTQSQLAGSTGTGGGGSRNGGPHTE